MSYDVIKTLHLTAVIIWMSTTIVAPMLILVTTSVPRDQRQITSAALKKHYQIFSNVGIVLTWGLGIILMVWGGWMQSPWMMIKLVFVLVFSGLHGFLSAQFRRALHEEGYSAESWAYPVIGGQIAMILVIVSLVIIKPF